MHARDLPLSQLTYELPQERIAQRPLEQRDAGRLLVFRDGRIVDRYFQDLPDLLPEGSMLVLNDTRVVNARLFLRRATGAVVEILCLEPGGGRPVEHAFADRGRSAWNGFFGNARKWRMNEELSLDDAGIHLSAIRTGHQQVMFTWAPNDLSFAEVLERVGHVPLPPYMDRSDTPADKVRYNTVFARHEGSVAAPTASLHLTPEILQRCAGRNIRIAKLTLHVGASTFLPVKSDTMAGHRMHQEQVRIPLHTLEALQDQLIQGRPIIAVGTTALRTLESLYWHGVHILQGAAKDTVEVEQWEPYDQPMPDVDGRIALQAIIARMHGKEQDLCSGVTRLLIAPGYRFQFADALVTNFHQPGSTLLLLVAAFIGDDWRMIYEHALGNGYRFLSYGDGSILFRKDASK